MNGEGGPYYSNQPPHLRPQYTPPSSTTSSQPQQHRRLERTPPPPIGEHYTPPGTSQGQPSSFTYAPLKSQPLPRTTRRETYRRRTRYYSSDDDEYYGGGGGDYAESTTSRRAANTRPQTLARRNSSHPGYGRSSTGGRSRRGRSSDSYNINYSSDDYSEGESSRRSGRSRNRTGRKHAKGKRAPGGGHEKLQDHFTRTPVGTAAGVVGALVGGLAARRAHDSPYVAKEKKGSGSAFLTFLGAAVGGMTVNAVVDRMEEKRMAKEANGGGDGDRGRGRA